MTELPMGTLITPNGLYGGLWALPRPLTRGWGQGDELIRRMTALLGSFDVSFGKRDQVNGFPVTVDSDPSSGATVVADWASMPFSDRHFRSGYWDPPYIGKLDAAGGVHWKRLDPCYREIARVIDYRLVVLHPLIYPKPKGFRREAVIATTMGPNKIVRALQSFVREGVQEALPC